MNDKPIVIKKINSFYSKLMELLPYKSPKVEPFRYSLNYALKKYTELVSTHVDDDVTRQDVSYITKKLDGVVKSYLEGLHSTAFAQLQFLIYGKKNVTAKIDIKSTILTLEKGADFYRMRQIEPHQRYEAKDVFHIPLTQRGLVKTQRYSAPGYPCLYLGESIYGCWEEMGRPPMHLCAVSKLQNLNDLNLIDLTIPSTQDMVTKSCICRLPLIIACMIPVKNELDNFKPEYIVPQLLIELVLKNRKNKGKVIHGIAYTSTHRNNEFEFPDKKFINYAIPTFDVLAAKATYCKTLCDLFKITYPTTNDIEKLKSGYGTKDRRNYNKDEYNYVSSDFGNLEDRLKNENNFPLISISYK
jgi:hypothetical protein